MDASTSPQATIADALVMYGYKVQGAVLAVDMCDELRDLSLELGGIRKRRRRDLDEDHISLPLRIILQQFLERTELSETGQRS